MTLTYLDPAAEAGTPVVPYEVCLDTSARPLTLALVANAYPDTENFMDYLERSLAELLPGAALRRYQKRDEAPVPPEVLADIIEQCDGVVAAWGHCGGCTSGTVRDGVFAARAGLAAVVILTEQFLAEGEFVARATGMPGIPRVVVEHPVAGTGRENLARVARSIAPSIVAALTGDLARAIPARVARA